jgi:hypothetical protein
MLYINMVNTYKLVNPYISGNMSTNIKARNSVEAANMLYKGLSEHFNNSPPAFYFTIQKGGSGNGPLYHFKVSEKMKGDEVNFSVKQHTLNNNETSVTNFKNKLEQFKAKFDQLGGKKSKSRSKSKKSKKHNSSSESDSDLDVSSDELYKRVQSYVPVNQPIYYWWYDPYLYNLNSVFLPTFYSYVSPLMELSLVSIP